MGLPGQSINSVFYGLAQPSPPCEEQCWVLPVHHGLAKCFCGIVLWNCGVCVCGVLYSVTWFFIADHGAPVVLVRSCLTASWEQFPRKKAKCDKEIYAHEGVTPAITWMSTSVTAFKWVVWLTALFSCLLSCKHTVVFSQLQGRSDLTSSVHVQEGIFSMARVLLKLEILPVDQHILLWADFLECWGFV